MTKKTYITIGIILALLIAAAVWWGGMQKEREILPTAVESADTTDAIQKDLGAIDIGDVDVEFKDVDEAIKTL